MDVRIRFTESFKDYNFFPDVKKLNEEIVISQVKAEQIKNSGAYFEILETIIPKHKVEDGKS